MIFDIKNFHSSVSKKLLDDSLNFRWQHLQIKGEGFNFIENKKMTTLQQGNSVAKEKHQSF